MAMRSVAWSRPVAAIGGGFFVSFGCERCRKVLITASIRGLFRGCRSCARVSVRAGGRGRVKRRIPVGPVIDMSPSSAEAMAMSMGLSDHPVTARSAMAEALREVLEAVDLSSPRAS